MKTLHCLFCLLLTTTTSLFSSANSLFTSWSMTPFPSLFNEGPLIQPRVSRKEFDLLSNRLAILDRDMNGLMAIVQSLKEVTNSIQPKCPAQAIGAAIVDNLCYSLEVERTFAEAKSGCIAKGGKLAEPSLTNNDFYTRIKIALQAITAGTSNIFIGVSSSGTNFVYDSSKVPIDAYDPRWVAVPAVVSLEKNVGALVPPTPPAVAWKLVDVNPAESLPSLCQYNTVL